MRDLTRDVRHAARRLARTPMFTLATLVTLALGVLVLAFASRASAAVSFTPPAAHPVAGDGPIAVAAGVVSVR